MDFSIEKNEQYALIAFKNQSLNQENYLDFEKVIRILFREDYSNMIVDFSNIQDLDGFGVSIIRKANKICTNEAGLFIIVTKNEDITYQLDAAKIEDLTVMTSIQEAIDAVYLNELENSFQSEEDDEYDHGEYGDMPSSSGGGDDY
ncbi:MAG: anti-anti-sigma factor [Pseudarcicella sp.]|nr:anti-anti-sigma factor [Pseudarcicella sp.]MBP6410701.1 anti-anti-sigma factor [Pseudarcicella sp.]